VVGSRLREAMKAAGLTIQEVSDRLNVARTTISRWLSGQRVPDPFLLKQFAALVGRQPSEFWAADGDEYRARFTAGVIRILTRLAGDDPLPAVNALALEIPEPEISERERAFFARRAAHIKAEIQSLAQERFGRPWERLNYAERAALVERLMDEGDL
jgi:transcriptional regulator with XRE-family HTH domain